MQELDGITRDADLPRDPALTPGRPPANAMIDPRDADLKPT